MALKSSCPKDRVLGGCMPILYGIILFYSFFSCSSIDLQDYYDENLNQHSKYIAVIGDIQSYTISDSTMEYYKSTINWLRNQIDSGIKIKSVLQLGDITEINSPFEWNLFKHYSINLYSVIPFYVCTGNHDYDWDEQSKIKNRSSSHINEYAHFYLSDSNIVDYYDTNSLENYISKLPIDDSILLIALEFGPRVEVVKWASDHVVSHPNNSFILMTHEWLTRRGIRISSGSYAESHFSGYSSYSTPEEIWRSLVKPNNNIVCVICGHNGFSCSLFSKNDAGRDVPQILFNLQYQDNGGNGLIQLWEFPQGSDSLNICVYDTINQNWYMPDSTKLTFKFKNYL